MIALRIAMPSQGDMTLLNQEGGIIDLAPVFFNAESSGPHLQVVEIENGKVTRIHSRYRIKMRAGTKLQLIEGQVS